MKVFQCSTTFERALTLPGTLRMLSAAAESCGASNAAKRLREAAPRLKGVNINQQPHKGLLEEMRTSVLATAKRFGKARFAQAASKHIKLANEVPDYVKAAVAWLMEP